MVKFIASTLMCREHKKNQISLTTMVHCPDPNVLGALKKIASFSLNDHGILRRP